MSDEKRFAFIPLKVEDSLKALIGELMIDRETGDVWTKNEDGELVSPSLLLEERVIDIINNRFNFLSYAYNNNKRIYRFFYENNVVRLDRNLNLSEQFTYFRIREIGGSIYYVNELTPVDFDGTALYPFQNNNTYFVELFNADREMTSQIVFIAKYAPSILADDDPAKIINRIEIHTNKDFLYQGEDASTLIVSVFAIYEDNSAKNITGFANLSVTNPVNTEIIDVYRLEAIYYYDMEGSLYVETSKEIAVIEDVYSEVVDMVVLPKKIINLHDGTRSIVLSVIVYYADNTVENITDSEKAIITNFNPSLFNTDQIITVSFNAGATAVVERDYTINVADSGASSGNILLYTSDKMLRLVPESTLDPTFMYYKVRDPQDLEFYYTTGFQEVNYDASFIEKIDLTNRIQTGSNIIVEFYNLGEELLDSVVFSALFTVSLD